jgi:Cu2+-exporting ATPase
VSTPVVFYAGWPFIAGMPRASCAAARLGMDTLIAGSTLLAYGASVVETRAWRRACLVRRRGDVRVPAAGGAPARNAAHGAVRGPGSMPWHGPARHLPRANRTMATLRQVALAALQCGDVVRVAAGDAGAGRR